jgi:hypothetical protein
MAALLLALALLPGPLLATDADLHAGSHDAALAVRAGPDGLRGDAWADGHHEWADQRSECVVDDGRCQTDVDCDPGTLDCHAYRRPRPPWPCAYEPDGSLVCPADGGTAPDQSAQA